MFAEGRSGADAGRVGGAGCSNGGRAGAKAETNRDEEPHARRRVVKVAGRRKIYSVKVVGRRKIDSVKVVGRRKIYSVRVAGRRKIYCNKVAAALWTTATL